MCSMSTMMSPSFIITFYHSQRGDALWEQDYHMYGSIRVPLCDLNVASSFLFDFEYQ